MGEQQPSDYYSTFERPAPTIQIRSKKRPLHHQSTAPQNNNNKTVAVDSPKKRTKRTKNETFVKKTKDGTNKRPFGAQPPPPDDVTNEDSSLLFELFKNNNNNNPSSLSQSPLSSSPSASSSPSSHHGTSCIISNSIPQFPQPRTPPPSTGSRAGISSYIDLLIQTPSPPQRSDVKRRQKLTPAPIPLSPAFVSGEKAQPFRLGGIRSKSRVNLQDKFVDEADNAGVVKRNISEEEWASTPPLDWSLKNKLTLFASKPFTFVSSGLKSSEESSGTSAFARCIDINPSSGQDDPQVSPQAGSQLDSSIGAQFHQCCLYWQHPTLPTQSLFPRVSGTTFPSLQTIVTPISTATLFGGIRMEQKVLDGMLEEWVVAFRSLFQLLRTRQCPYFYVCTNQFTALFCAAGTQGIDYLQAYVSPSTKGFRDSLSQEGIEFTTPCSSTPSEEGSIQSEEARKPVKDESDGEEAADKWLDEMGISQDVSLSQMKTSPGSLVDEKNKSSLVVIAGTHTQSFYNHLIKSKNLLVSPTGAFAGLPPTILSPVAFHGATLKQLKVKYAKVGRSSTGDISYCLEVTGPILPHVIHMLCPVLQKTVQDFKIRTTPLPSTINLNLHSKFISRSHPRLRASAFELQNLSDCGLTRRVLEIFCRPDSVDTVSSHLECKNGRYRW